MRRGFAQEQVNQLRNRIRLAGGAQLVQTGDDDGVNDRVQFLRRRLVGQGVQQGGFQFGQLHRLVDEPVHARRRAFFPVVGLGVGRHGDDVNPFARVRRAGFFLLAITNLPGRLIAADAGHLAVHQNNVVGFARVSRDRLVAVARGIGRVAEFFQLLERHLLVERRVLRHEDAHGLGG